MGYCSDDEHWTKHRMHFEVSGYDRELRRSEPEKLLVRRL